VTITAGPLKDAFDAINGLQASVAAITNPPPNTTATFGITNANIVSTFVGTDTVVGGVTARGFYADAEIAFSARGSSCTLPSVYLTGSNQATVTVDGQHVQRGDGIHGPAGHNPFGYRQVD
jgi:hypothetical protein